VTVADSPGVVVTANTVSLPARRFEGGDGAVQIWRYNGLNHCGGSLTAMTVASNVYVPHNQQDNEDKQDEATAAIPVASVLSAAVIVAPAAEQ
jgi:hypothetical protein